MTTKSRGFRSKSRNILKKGRKEKFTVEKFMKEFKAGDKVLVRIDPTSMKGMPHRRFKGKIGTVKEQRGRGFLVEVMDGSKAKKLTTRAEHLQVRK